MLNSLLQWIRKSYGADVTSPNLPPLRTRFFSKLYDSSESDTDPTPIGDEGTQNGGDNTIKGKKTKIKISLVNVSKDFFIKNFIADNYKNYLNNSSQISTKYKKIFDNNLNNIPCLLFEDFNTTGLLGDPYTQKSVIKGKRNDFHAFWWSIFSKNKGQGKGGSVGVGRLVFAFSSEIQTFFSFSVPYDNSKGKKLFLGLSVLGDSIDETGNTEDPFARFGARGKMNNGAEGTLPIFDENILKDYHSKFKLKREFNEPGLSMIVPFPSKDLCQWNNLYKNLISRYRYAIINDQVEIEVNQKTISKNTIIEFVKKYIPDQLEKYQIYFNFLQKTKNVADDKINTFYIRENAGKLKRNMIPKEKLDQLSKDYTNEQLVSTKFNFDIDKQDGTKFTAEVFAHIQKTSSNNGCDDLMRQSMPVSGERQFENRDANALTLIVDDETAEFCRLSESENHKKFDPATLDERNTYEKFHRKLRFITNLSHSLHQVLLESEAETTSTDATKNWFDFGDDSDEETQNESSEEGTGTDTKVVIPENLFEDPKIYKIDKIQENNKNGFKIVGSDVAKITKQKLSQITKILDVDLKKSKDNDHEEKDVKRLKEEDIKRLKKQKDKLEKRLKNNCKDLFPGNFHVTIWEDMQKYAKRSKNFYDPVNDFDLETDIGKDFEVEHHGVTSVKGKENKIQFIAENYDFSYRMLTNKLKSRDGLPADLGASAYVKREVK